MSREKIILLITSREKQLNAFSEALQADTGVKLIAIDSAEAAVEAAVRVIPVLAIIDQDVGGVSGLDIAKRLLEVNAFIYTAVLTDMDEALFHERSEGLGVLSEVVMHPGKKDAVDLLDKLNQIAPVQ